MRRAFVVLMMLSACARTSGTVEIPADELPFPLARASTGTGSPAPSRTFTVYFVRDQRLVAIRRATTEDAPPAEAALRALLDGPTEAESARRIRSALPRAVRFLAVSADGPTAHVDLSGEFQEPASAEVVAMRVAQVTWTLTALRGVEEVAFAIDGEQLSVTAGDGSTLDRPARRSDYGAFAPRG